jgi:hypothetical protein
MAGFMDANTSNLHRTNLWSRTLKELLKDELIGLKFVRILTDFPDGYTFNIPSIGEAKQFDFTEGSAIKYDSMDTGNFTFSFDQYKYSANAMSEKFKRDSFYSQSVISSFIPKQHRVLMEGVETRILAVANASQTAANNNNINSSAHRFVASGASQVLTFADLARARNSLVKANVPLTNLCGIIDPATAYFFETQTNVVNLLTPVQKWGNIVNDGIITGLSFAYNLMGFDIYISNYLPAIASETIDAVAVTSGVANYFFSAAPGDTLPWVGAFRQMPTVYHEFNKDLQQDEYLTITEYGFKLYRPENLVTILSKGSVT